MIHRRHRKHDPASESTRARQRAELELEKTRRQTDAIAQFAARMRELRERNHFAEAITATIRGHQ